MQRYIATVRAAGLGDRDLSSPAAVAPLVSSGRSACKLVWYPYPSGPAGYQRLVRITILRVRASRRQAEILVDSAVRDLCPWFASYLPPGAP